MSSVTTISREKMLASYAPGIEGDLIPFLAELDKDEEDALLSSELQFMTTVVTENAVGILGGIAGTVGSVWGIGDATGHWSLFGTPSCPEIETSNRLLSLLIKAAAPETARSLITCVSAPVFVFIGLAYAGAKIDVARSKLNQSRLKRLSKKVDSIEEELRSSVLSHREEQQLKQALIFFDVAYSPKSFYRACIRGDIRRIKKWFEENPQRVNEEYQEKSYLIIAIIAGRVPIVGELLSRESSLMYKKGDPGIGGSQKWSPFVFSIYYDKKEAMEKMVALDPLLLNKRENREGDGQEVADVGWTPLLRAAQWKKLDIMQWIVEKDRSVLMSAMDNGDTALHVSARAGHLEGVKWLISKNKALLDCKNLKGERAEDVATSEDLVAFFRDLYPASPPVTHWYDPIMRFLRMLIPWLK